MSFQMPSFGAAPAATQPSNLFSIPAATSFAPAATPSFNFNPQPASTNAFSAPAASNAFSAPAAGGFSLPTATNAFTAPASNVFSTTPSFSLTPSIPAAQPFGTNPLNPLATTSTAQAAPGSQITLNTRFTQLPDPYREAIEQTNVDYKKPMRDGLDEIARFQPKMLEELRIELGKTSLAAMKLGNQQEVLLAETKAFHIKAKDNLRDVRKYGASGLQQIQNRGGLAARSYLMSEELPTDFYVDAANKIENRLGSLIEEVQSISSQLSATLGLLSGDEGQYGQQTRIGPQHLVRLIQRQSEAFARVAACVAEVHKQADDMRASYLQSYCYDDSQRYPGNHSRSDPFAAADRAEAASQRIISKKLKAEEFNRALATAAAAAPATSLTAAPSAAPTSAFGFATPAATAAPLSGFGQFSAAAPSAFGGFGAPAAGFGAPSTGFGAPATSFGAPATGFGAPVAAPASFGSSFGAPAAGGFGGQGFKALDLATTGTSLGFGAAVPAPGAFGATFGTGGTTSRKSGSKSRK